MSSMTNDDSDQVVTAETETRVHVRRSRGSSSLRYKNTGVQHGNKTRKITRQTSVQQHGSRRVLNSPPPKHTPPLYDDDTMYIRRASPRPSSPSPSSRLVVASSPPPRRVSSPLYIIGSHPLDGDQGPKTEIRYQFLEKLQI